jgi:hypothetical protein
VISSEPANKGLAPPRNKFARGSETRPVHPQSTPGQKRESRETWPSGKQDQVAYDQQTVATRTPSPNVTIPVDVPR